jgi:hypothetical protein
VYLANWPGPAVVIIDARAHGQVEEEIYRERFKLWAQARVLVPTMKVLLDDAFIILFAFVHILTRFQSSTQVALTRSPMANAESRAKRRKKIRHLNMLTDMTRLLRAYGKST